MMLDLTKLVERPREQGYYWVRYRHGGCGIVEIVNCGGAEGLAVYEFNPDEERERWPLDRYPNYYGPIEDPPKIIVEALKAGTQ